jgi:prepilin-type N-terminal cleavage/methylation domain-containing protein
MVQMVLAARRMNALGNTTKLRSGFTLLELVIVLVILGVLGTIVGPNLSRLSPRYEHDQFVSNIQALVRRAWQESLMNHQLHRIHFNLDKRIVKVERDTGKKSSSGAVVYEMLAGTYIPSAFEWPVTLQMKDFFADGADMFHVKGIKITEIWFFVFPDGTSQDVITNWFDQSDTRESDAGTRFSISVSPFIAKVTESYGFQKPS